MRRTIEYSHGVARPFVLAWQQPVTGSFSHRVASLALLGMPPQHWPRFTGPSNWFEIQYPPGWTVEDSGPTLRLAPPSGGHSLMVSCFRTPSDREVDLETAVDLGFLFPRRRHVRKLSSLSIPYRSVSLEGERALGDPPPWWKRPFVRTKWSRWRAWAVRHGSLFLVAVLVSGSDDDREVEGLASMILATLTLADDPADAPNEFAERVVELARSRFPLLACQRDGEFGIKVGESSLNLFNFYRAYITSPGRFEEILLPALTTMVQVQEWGKAQTEPDLDTVRDRIMPMLYPEEVWKESFPNFTGTPWVAGLMVLYVVDEPQAYWYVRTDLLKKWEMNLDDLHDLALRNLDDYFEKNPVEMVGGGGDEGPRLLMPGKADAYNTSRLLSPSFHGWARDVLGSQFAVGLPGRDFFVAVSLDDADMVTRIRRKVAEDYARMDHPLTERMLLVGPDGVSELCEDE